jgi:hypothetical protein
MAATGEGKDRRGDYQGTLADASSRKHPGLGWFPGWQGPAVERRQAAAAHGAWPVGTVVPGVERAPGPVRVSCVRNVETSPGSAGQARVCAGAAVGRP